MPIEYYNKGIRKRKEGKEMREEEIERLILGIDEEPTESWKALEASWDGGALVMPQDEVKRRRAYKKALKDIFEKNGVTPESVSDSWLAGKIRRILK